MPQAIVNPEELERFAQSLRQFNAQLTGNMARLESQFSNLGDTWGDQEQVRFAQEFQQTMQFLHRYIKKSEDEHIRLLMRKAARVREYLNQR